MRPRFHVIGYRGRYKWEQHLLVELDGLLFEIGKVPNSVNQNFVLDPADRDTIGTEFVQNGGLLTTSGKGWNDKLPLPEVMEAIKTWAKGFPDIQTALNGNDAIEFRRAVLDLVGVRK